MSKLWGGVFTESMSKQVLEYTTSLSVDERLWDYDIRASFIHAEMLGKQGIIPQKEAEEICRGLLAVRQKIIHAKSQNQVLWQADAEDVHSEIERLLREEIGPIAGKLHTARSRNDQVITLTKLYAREELSTLEKALRSLQANLLDTAQGKEEWIMPGLTHTQHAQPVSLAHHLLAYFWMFQRDRKKAQEIRGWTNESPLGAAALAGTSFSIDRHFTADKLGFEGGPVPNSLDAVSDRDFILDTLHLCTLVMIHLSKISEEWIHWCTPEYGFIKLSDQVTTGSSIMPQKRNPDVNELIRGRVGRVQAAWVGLATTLKGLPLAYNRDLQEDKSYLFEGLDTTISSVRIMDSVVKQTKFNKERLASTLQGDGSNATDLADLLAEKGLPFREAHEIAGKAVLAAQEMQVPLEKLTQRDLARIHPALGGIDENAISHKRVFYRRHSYGGCAPERVVEQFRMALRSLE